MKLSQREKRIPQTLTNSNDIIQTDREYARRSSRARSTRGQENEAWEQLLSVLFEVCMKKKKNGHTGIALFSSDLMYKNTDKKCV